MAVVLGKSSRTCIMSAMEHFRLALYFTNIVAFHKVLFYQYVLFDNYENEPFLADYFLPDVRRFLLVSVK